MFSFLATSCNSINEQVCPQTDGHLTGYVVFICTISLAVSFLKDNTCRVAETIIGCYYQIVYFWRLKAKTGKIGIMVGNHKKQVEAADYYDAIRKLDDEFKLLIHHDFTSNFFWTVYEIIVYLMVLFIVCVYAFGTLESNYWYLTLFPIGIILIRFLFWGVVQACVAAREFLNDDSVYHKMQYHQMDESFRELQLVDLSVRHVSWCAVVGKKDSMHSFCCGCIINCPDGHNFVVYTDGISSITFDLSS